MAMGCQSTRAEKSIEDIGRMINLTDEVSYTRIQVVTKAILLQESSKVKVSNFFLTGTLMMEITLKTSSMDKEGMSGKIRPFMKESLKNTIWTVKVIGSRPTGTLTKANTSKV
jgi:hypothetical protein